MAHGGQKIAFDLRKAQGFLVRQIKTDILFFQLVGADLNLFFQRIAGCF